MHDPKPHPFPPRRGAPRGVERGPRAEPRWMSPEYTGSRKLLGRAALITGGDSGIGRAVAVLFAREGADVALVYVDDEQADARETARAVEQEGRRAIMIPGDVRNPAFCAEAVEGVVHRFGKIDILVNNAAVRRHTDDLHDLADVRSARTFETNVSGCYHMTRCALPYLRPGSAIINTGSIAGLEGSNRLIDYAATRGAIHAFTKSLAQTLRARRIRVNCVAPGPVWAPRGAAECPDCEDCDGRDIDSGGQPGPPPEPEEIAPVYVFLASDADSSYITGHVLQLLGSRATA